MLTKQTNKHSLLMLHLEYTSNVFYKLKHGTKILSKEVLK